MKKLLITDLDGTIIQSMPVAWEFLNKVAKRNGKKLEKYANYSSTLGLYINIFQVFGFRAFKLLPRMRREMYLKKDQVNAYPGAIEALQSLHNNGWKVAIVTDNDDEYARVILEQNGLLDHSWLEIHSAEVETKVSLIVKVLRKYPDYYVYYASHDYKDFFMLDVAKLFAFKTAKKIFTPNEIDRFSLVQPHLTLAEFAKLYVDK